MKREVIKMSKLSKLSVLGVGLVMASSVALAANQSPGKGRCLINKFDTGAGQMPSEAMNGYCTISAMHKHSDGTFHVVAASGFLFGPKIMKDIAQADDTKSNFQAIGNEMASIIQKEFDVTKFNLNCAIGGAPSKVSQTQQPPSIDRDVDTAKDLSATVDNYFQKVGTYYMSLEPMNSSSAK